jgi:hypothetical protein
MRDSALDCADFSQRLSEERRELHKLNIDRLILILSNLELTGGQDGDAGFGVFFEDVFSASPAASGSQSARMAVIFPRGLVFWWRSFYYDEPLRMNLWKRTV